MNSALLPNSLMSQSLLPPPASSANTPPNGNGTSSMEQGSSPLRPQDKPENGLSINYAGRVSVLSHSHLYGGVPPEVNTFKALIVVLNSIGFIDSILCFSGQY